MSNSNIPTNARCCDSGDDDVVVITFFSLVVVAICSLIVVFLILHEAEKLALQAQLEADMASHDSKENRRSDSRREREENVSIGLIVK